MNKKIAALYDAGHTDRAIHLLIKQIDAHPKQVENYLQLSTFLIDQKSPEQAQKLLEQATQLVDKPKELYYNLAVCYYVQGNFKKALTLLQQIPNDDLTLYQKALVYLKLGQTAQALAFALSIKRTDKRTKELVGDIWLSRGAFAQARASYLSIPASARSAKIYFLLGVTTLSQNRTKAEKYFAQAKKMDDKYYKKARQQYAGLLKMVAQGKKNG